jgi:hypothetical protein
MDSGSSNLLHVVFLYMFGFAFPRENSSRLINIERELDICRMGPYIMRRLRHPTFQLIFGTAE